MRKINLNNWSLISMDKVLLAVAFAVSFAIMFLGLLMFIYHDEAQIPYYTGLLVTIAGVISFIRFLPENK